MFYHDLKKQIDACPDLNPSSFSDLKSSYQSWMGSFYTCPSEPLINLRDQTQISFLNSYQNMAPKIPLNFFLSDISCDKELGQAVVPILFTFTYRRHSGWKSNCGRPQGNSALLPAWVPKLMLLRWPCSGLKSPITFHIWSGWHSDGGRPLRNSGLGSNVNDSFQGWILDSTTCWRL